MPDIDLTTTPLEQHDPFPKSVMACGGGAMIVGALGFIGQFRGLEELGQFGTEFIPMAPSTSVLFLLMGGVIVSQNRKRPSKMGRAIESLMIALGIGGVILSAAGLILGDGYDFERFWALPESILGKAPEGQMSPLGAINFLLVGAALAGLQLSRPGAFRARQLAGYLAAAESCLTLTVLVGYLFGTPLFYGTKVIPMALTTALGFLFMNTGLILSIGPAYFPMRPFMGQSAQARLLRYFLPISLVSAIIPGIVFHFLTMAGNENSPFIAAVSALVCMAATATAIVQVSRILGQELGDAKRRYRASESAREEIDAALRRSEARFQAFMNHGPFAAFILDDDGHVVYTNDSCGQSHTSRLIHDAAERLREAKATGTAPTAKTERLVTVKAENGPPHHYLVIGFPLETHGNGTLVGKFAVDLTETVNTERKLRELTEDLLRSNQELQTFAAVASHDLQEPLRKVRAFGGRLKDECEATLNENGQDYLERMLSAVERMQTLIEDLLTFSRVTSKAMPFAPVDLNHVVTGVLSDLELLIKETGATLEIDPLPHIDADETQMRQLFQNFLSNALKFQNPDVSPVIAIKCLEPERSEDGDETFCRIAVQDNGIGFDEKYSTRIFGIFQRLHARTKYQGTGIGLAVCRKIVERHGGLISVRSKPGVGTTFEFTLPKRHHDKEIAA